MWNSEAQSQVPGVKTVWCREAGQRQQGLETVCCLKRHRSAIKLRVSVLLVTRFASWTAEWGSVRHTWLLGMGGCLQNRNKHPTSGLEADWSMLIFFTLKTYSGKKIATSKGGQGLWTLRYLLSKWLKEASASRAAISVAVRAIEMRRECPQQECFITLCVLGREAGIKVNG